MKEIILTQEYIDEMEERHELYNFSKSIQDIVELTSSYSSVDFLKND